MEVVQEVPEAAAVDPEGAEAVDAVHPEGFPAVQGAAHPEDLGAVHHGILEQDTWGRLSGQQ